jgi:peptidoglycan/LPS O-acetylase OafA/YrhL
MKRGGSLPYMPGIDALRAIAVLAVFVYHADADWMPGGFRGVDVFFVISGYLITALLLGEYRGAGHLDVVAFWLRRARRLLPAVGVMIAVTLVVAAIAVPEDVADLRIDALFSLLYVNNWHLVLSDQSYFEQFQRPSLFRHLWSLSVEEQFYLLWPLAFAAGMKLVGKRRVLLVAIAGALLSTLLMALLYDPGQPTDRVFYGADTRAVGLLAGVALALVWHPADLRAAVARPNAGRWLDAAGAVALALIAWDLLTTSDFEPFAYRGGFLALAIWTALLIAALAHPAARIGGVLGNRPLVWLGLRSYSFYLWHWPVLALTRPELDVSLWRPLLVALQLGATLLLADLSYRYVEQPFRRRSDAPGAPGWLPAARRAMAAAVVAVVLLVGWSGVVATDDGEPEAAVASGPRVVLAKVDPKVLAIGDSVMRGAAADLAAALGDEATINTFEGRQPREYPGVLDEYRRQGRLPDRVVIHVGNNGPVLDEDIARLRASLAGVDNVFLVNVQVPRSWRAEVNDKLASSASSWPQAQVLDWHGTVRADMTVDGIHLNPSGRRAYARLIARAVRAAAPAAAR